MHIFKYNDIVPWEVCTATVGFFDGLHSGHQFLIKELVDLAHHKGQNSLVVTFDKHPLEITRKGKRPQLLTSLDEKLALLRETGVDACYVLDFSYEMSLLSARDFMQNILKDKLKVRNWLVGYDHRVGHKRSEGFEQYRAYGLELGMEVIQAERFSSMYDSEVSSSDVRRALSEGDMERANRLLDYPYSFTGKVIGGFKIGKKVGFPTANLKLDNQKIIPAKGVYVVKVRYQNRVLKGMMNIGCRPTVSNSTEDSIEVHIIDFSEEIYAQYLVVEVYLKMRDEIKFGSIDELIEQLKKDKEYVIESNF